MDATCVNHNYTVDEKKKKTGNFWWKSGYINQAEIG